MDFKQEDNRVLSSYSNILYFILFLIRIASFFNEDGEKGQVFWKNGIKSGAGWNSRCSERN